MSIVKFMKTDFILTKSMYKVIIAFLIIAMFLSLYMNNSVFGMGFLCFGGIIFANTPFSYTQVPNCGFMNLLPASTYTRIAGRYLFGMVMTFGSVAAGTVVWVISNFFYLKRDSQELVPVSLLMLAATITALALQYLIMYIKGINVNNPVTVFLQLMPGFALFTVSTPIMNSIMDRENFGSFPMILASLAGAVVILLLSIGISYQLCKRRDLSL